MAVDQHYENFPVASLLVPATIRPHVVSIYRFARHADDLADEGTVDDEQRLASLDALRRDVENLFRLEPVSAATVSALTPLRDADIPGISAKPFLELLSAFTQDVTTHHFSSYTLLQDYCSRSAEPIGRLMLALAGIHEPHALLASDRICSALQLVNFWQDAAIDASRGRIYVPQEDFQAFGVSELDFPSHPRHRDLMKFQCQRTHALLSAGIPLLGRLRGRLRLEIALTVAGGLRILEKIERNNFDVSRRPQLRWYDSPRLIVLAGRALYRSKLHPS